MTKRLLHLTACVSLAAASLASAQTLSPKWEDLTSADFVKAVQKADGVCILPMGSIEKFGPSAPLGTNVYLGRLIPLEAVKQEYAVIFPDYFVAGTTDTSTLPGTIHYSMGMQLEMLHETTNEMARNGCKKVILANGHTGNNNLINLFMQNLLSVAHDYVVYFIYSSAFPVNDVASLPPAARPSKPGADGHGGEERVAALLAYYPELIHLDRAHDEPSSPGHGAEGPRSAQPPVGHVGSLPTGYSGDAAGATAARGKALVEIVVDKLVVFIRAVKADNDSLKNQQAFYEQTLHPRQPAAPK